MALLRGLITPDAGRISFPRTYHILLFTSFLLTLVEPLHQPSVER